jgi:hypothetical protein
VIVASDQASWTDAPSFVSIAKRPGISQKWLSDFLLQPHKHMLTDDYTRAQANSIADYILSLNRK